MTGTTANHNLPYPLGTDAVRLGDDTIRDLAEAVDGALTGLPVVERVLQGADAMGNAGPGVADQGLINRARVWLLDPDPNSVLIAGLVTIPDIWATMHIDVLWAIPTAGTGDAVLRLDHAPVVEGSPVPDNPTGGLVTVAPPAAEVVERTRLVTDAPVTGGPTWYEVFRLGTSVDDTLDTALGLLAVEFVRAS